MNTRLITHFLLLLSLGAIARDTTTLEVTSEMIGDNLDLQAVASAFAEAKDLEEFEQMLNDPETQISNLDLNGDEQVDYLRVVEIVKDSTHVVTIQAVIGEDVYQDVATIEAELKEKGKEQVQIVGDEALYGTNYIIEPVYVVQPLIYVSWWYVGYSPWYSPWYWGYHPPYYRPWRPYPVHHYHLSVHKYVNTHHRYNTTTVRRSHSAQSIQKANRKTGYSSKPAQRPSNGATTHPATGNKQAKPATSPDNKSSGRPVQKDWKPASKGDKSSNYTTPNDDLPSGGNGQKSNKPTTSQTPYKSDATPAQKKQQPATTTQPKKTQQQRSTQQKPKNPHGGESRGRGGKSR